MYACVCWCIYVNMVGACMHMGGDCYLYAGGGVGIYVNVEMYIAWV